MNLNDFSDLLKQRLSRSLPGNAAHASLRATPVGSSLPLFSHTLAPRPGGVLILLYEQEGVLKFPLIKRPEYLGAHSGQVSLPGGKAEQGEDSIQAALREAEEEIGVNRMNLNVLGTLSDFFVVPSNFVVTPVVAMLLTAPVFVPDPYEVAKILHGSVDDLMQEGAIKEKEILAAGKYRMLAPHFDIEGEVVWGATAMMLNEFRMVLKDII